MWEPGREDAQNERAIEALVRATAALSREKDWTVLIELSSGLGTWSYGVDAEDGKPGTVCEISDFCGRLYGT